MVLSAGYIEEFDSPQRLYEARGAFHKMIIEAGLDFSSVGHES